MSKQNIRSEKAVVIIPEIYGINQYIRDWTVFFKHRGYDTYCVDLIGEGRSFSYLKCDEAYAYFTTAVGFDQFKEIADYIRQLKKQYKKIIVWGSSVGAAIAWRLTESQSCDGMIGYYGSRIRDYLEVKPSCSCLLLFPSEERSFEVEAIIPKLNQKKNVEVHVLSGKHGFADSYGSDFHAQSCESALVMVTDFLSEIEQSEQIEKGGNDDSC